MDFHQCFDDRRKSLSLVEENGYSGANNWLAFWLYLVTSSYFLLSKQVNFVSGSRVKSEENVSLSNISIPNERKINGSTVVDDAVSYSESLGSPYSTFSFTYFDAYSEISDFDGTSYLHSLLSLEDEDSDWLSDSMVSEKSSSPLSHNSDSFTEFSDVHTPGYWDSLLKLEEEDSEWNLDKASYLHSLLSLEDEDEDSEWLSDSMTSEKASSPLSFNGDSFTDISDVGTPSYWDSLLKLDEEEDGKWISNSTQGLDCVQDGSPVSSYKINWGTVVLPTISTVSSFSGAHCGKLEDVFAEHLLETVDIEEFNGDQPIFWPFEGEFDWDYEESSFCNSPRKRHVFGSNMDIPLEYFALDQEFAIETLVGLKEFDGHEGLELDYEFIGDGFMLEEFLQ